jgi:predicted nucleic acid-binding protein
VIVLDTPVLAYMDRRDADHKRVRDWMKSSEEELSSTPLTGGKTFRLLPADSS